VAAAVVLKIQSEAWCHAIVAVVAMVADSGTVAGAEPVVVTTDLSSSTVMTGVAEAAAHCSDQSNLPSHRPKSPNGVVYITRPRNNVIKI